MPGRRQWFRCRCRREAPILWSRTRSPTRSTPRYYRAPAADGSECSPESGRARLRPSPCSGIGRHGLRSARPAPGPRQKSIGPSPRTRQMGSRGCPPPHSLVQPGKARPRPLPAGRARTLWSNARKPVGPVSARPPAPPGRLVRTAECTTAMIARRNPAPMPRLRRVSHFRAACAARSAGPPVAVITDVPVPNARRHLVHMWRYRLRFAHPASDNTPFDSAITPASPRAIPTRQARVAGVPGDDFA